MMRKLTLFVVILYSFQMKAQNKMYFYQLDTLHSEILWKCDKHSGNIKLHSGGFIVENDSLIDGLFGIRVNSLKDLDMSAKEYGTAVLILENTLKNEFLEVEKYPNASFKLLNIEKETENSYLITGDFSMHGITVCLSFKAKIKINNNEIELHSERFVIDRTDWGIYRMSPQNPYLDDENGWTVPDKVEIEIILKTKKQEDGE